MTTIIVGDVAKGLTWWSQAHQYKLMLAQKYAAQFHKEKIGWTVDFDVWKHRERTPINLNMQEWHYPSDSAKIHVKMIAGKPQAWIYSTGSRVYCSYPDRFSASTLDEIAYWRAYRIVVTKGFQEKTIAVGTTGYAGQGTVIFDPIGYDFGKDPNGYWIGFGATHYVSWDEDRVFIDGVASMQLTNPINDLNDYSSTSGTTKDKIRAASCDGTNLIVIVSHQFTGGLTAYVYTYTFALALGLVLGLVTSYPIHSSTVGVTFKGGFLDDGQNLIGYSATNYAPTDTSSFRRLSEYKFSAGYLTFTEAIIWQYPTQASALSFYEEPPITWPNWTIDPLGAYIGITEILTVYICRDTCYFEGYLPYPTGGSSYSTGGLYLMKYKSVGYANAPGGKSQRGVVNTAKTVALTQLAFPCLPSVFGLSGYAGGLVCADLSVGVAAYLKYARDPSTVKLYVLHNGIEYSVDDLVITMDARVTPLVGPYEGGMSSSQYWNPTTTYDLETMVIAYQYYTLLIDTTNKTIFTYKKLNFRVDQGLFRPVGRLDAQMSPLSVTRHKG